jgi:DNA-binding NtrC family response regulator
MLNAAERIIVLSDQKYIGEFYKNFFASKGSSVILLDSVVKLSRMSPQNCRGAILANISSLYDKKTRQAFKNWLSRYSGSLVVLSAETDQSYIRHIMRLPKLSACYLLGQAKPEQVLQAIERELGKAPSAKSKA